MRKHVRVSEILARLQSYQDIDPVILEAKAKIGTNVHQAIVEDCSQGFVVLECDRSKAYFESYAMWKNLVAPKIRQVPRLYCDMLMITGECDGIWTNPLNGSECLIDWKCSASPNKTIWNMQAHFYWYLLNVNGIDVAENMLWVNLRHDKHTFRDSKTGAISRVTYTAKSPIVHEFTFDEQVLAQCIEEAHKYWAEKENEKIVV